jgi:hypothetical protein
MDYLVSLFPGWVPDQVIYILFGVFLAGVLVILFPPVKMPKK